MLTFDALHNAAVARLPQFKNKKGEFSHPEADGSDWKLSAWSNALCGELGEAANIIKKIERGDFTLEEARPELADELADVQSYLAILAFRAGVNLGEATISKFNRVSDKVGSNIKICKILRSEILQAIARGYCSKENESKVLDHDLCQSIADEIIKVLK